MQVLERVDGVDFHEALEEMLGDLERKTDLAQDGNTDPVAILIYSDGRLDEDGKRVLDTRAFFNGSPMEIAEFVEQHL